MLKLFRNFNGKHTQFLDINPNFRTLSLYSTSSSNPTQINPSFANYLEESLGFSKQQSLSTYTKLAQYWKIGGDKKVSDFKFAENANSVISCFQQHGFNETQIRDIVCFDPRLLSSNVDKTLNPKFKLLQEQGFSGSDIKEVICSNPGFLMINSDSSLLPAIKTLKEILGCDLDVISFLKSSHWKTLSCLSKYVEPNVALLRDYGISNDLIRTYLLNYRSRFIIKPETFKEVVIKVEEMGLTRDSNSFMRGVCMLIGHRTSIDAKMERLKSFGWTETDILTLFKRNPFCFTMSLPSISKKMEYLMNQLGFKPAELVSNCSLLTCSLEKRIMPRQKVLELLKEKGLVKKIIPLHFAIWLPESKFLNKFVLPFEEVCQMYAEVTGTSMQKLTLGVKIECQ